MASKTDITIMNTSISFRNAPIVDLMVKGFRAIGATCTVLQHEMQATDARKIAVWGWHKGRRMRARSRDILVMERGYIGDRFHYTSLGWNGLNGHAIFPEYPDDGGERFRSHGAVLKPWKNDGDYALILGQVPGDASLQGKDLTPFYASIATEIRRVYGIPVHFRQHPEAEKRGRPWNVPGWVIKSTGTLDEALSGAAFTASYNSNASVLSVLAGVPAFVADRGSMAWDVCSHDITKIIRPDREDWAMRTSFTQWSPAEIESGLPLRALMDMTS